jgi:hypothetical protein
MLKYGLSVILVFIGIKMLIVDFYHIPSPSRWAWWAAFWPSRCLLTPGSTSRTTKSSAVRINGRVICFTRSATFAAQPAHVTIMLLHS